MAAACKSLQISNFSLLLHSSKRLHFQSLRPRKCSFFLLPQTRPFSSPPTPYPLQYDMIISHPSPRVAVTKLPPPSCSKPTESSDSDSPEPDPFSPELSFEDWIDRKLTQNENDRFNKVNDTSSLEGMDKSKRKFYKKREKRMYGDDSDDERRKMREKGEFVELRPEVVEPRTLHKREEELYFYDALAFPWEKDKHYKMVYQLEKKYFPEQCLDKAFLEPGQSNSSDSKGKPKKRKAENVGKGGEDKGLMFFEEGSDGRSNEGAVKDVSEKKVEEFFKCLKKVPNQNAEVSRVDHPFLASRTSGLPPKWDSPAGTVVLVNKPKGEGFFFVVVSDNELFNSGADAWVDVCKKL